jgi:hypothetical protein
MNKKINKEVDKLVNQMALKNGKQAPDAQLHQIVSFIKSGVRILGYAFLPFNIIFATLFLILSEIIGIVEEIV